MGMRFLPEEPIASSDKDALGLGQFAALIRGSIENTTCPFVFGVLGDWGTGKTSILRMLETSFLRTLETPFENRLTRERLWVPIWFNAWKYENETNVVYPLLHAIRESYTKRLSSEAREEMKKNFMAVVKSSTLALTDVGLRVVTKHLTGEAVKLEDIQKQMEFVEKDLDGVEKVLSRWTNEVDELQKAFDTLLGDYGKKLAKQHDAQPDAVHLVIIIDDLDRCLPHTAIAILESIKNYLTAQNCIFVLGINPRVIYQGIRVKYEGLEIDGREYLEKILNYSFYVPEPDPQAVANFARTKLGELSLDGATNDAAFEEFASVLKECRFSNPRKIHRILNRFLLFLDRNEQDLSKYNLANVSRFIIMAEYFPALFPLFLAQPLDVGKELAKAGTTNFDAKEFERKYGVSVLPAYQQITRMNELFDVTVQEVKGGYKLADQAKAVFDITRLV
jgi:hypothetical protein